LMMSANFLTKIMSAAKEACNSEKTLNTSKGKSRGF